MPLDTIDYNALAEALIQRAAGGDATTKAVSSTPTTTYGHGNGGLFSYPGMSKPIFNAMLLPRLGLQNILPVHASNEQNPLYAIMTGVTATTGSEPTGVCDDPPTAGLMKLCTQTATFGRMARQTRTFDLDRSGLITNRGEFTDYQLIGGPGDGNALMPTIPGGSGVNNALRTEAGKALFELGVAWSRDFARDIYTSSPANNTSGGGRTYFRGLDMLVNTGYRDAVTGQACPAADSIVRSFGNKSVETQATALITEMTDIWFQLQWNAAQMGLSPVKWVIALPPMLFYQITAAWPCSYLTYRCTGLQTGSTNFIDGADSINLRDQMRGNIQARTGQYLKMEGEDVQVVLDDAIAESGIGSGTQQASIYFIPLTVVGGVEATYIEHINYNMPGGALDMARAMAPNGFFEASDGGRFLWHKPAPNNFCVKLLAKAETRIVLRTPMLAARLTNIRYTPVNMPRSPFTDSVYHVDGGVTSYSGSPSFFSPTSAG